MPDKNKLESIMRGNSPSYEQLQSQCAKLADENARLKKELEMWRNANVSPNVNLHRDFDTGIVDF